MLTPPPHEPEGSRQLVITPGGAIHFPAARLDEHERRDDGYVVVDLFRVGEVGGYDVTVSYEGRGESDRIEQILIAWAGAVGIKRVFLPTGVADLSGVLPAAGGEVLCQVCGVYHRDTGMRFMEMVHVHSAFPHKCYICHSALPQRRPIGYEPEQAVATVVRNQMTVDEVLAEEAAR